MPTYLCSQQDVIDRFGGSAALSECLDPSGTGSIDLTVLDQARSDAAMTVLQKAGNRFSLGLESTPDNCPPFLRMCAAKLTVYECWAIGTRGQGIPANTIQMRAEVMAELTRIEEGKGTVGQPQPKDRIRRGPFDMTRGGTVRRVNIGRVRSVMY